jgi:hypothetical protein
MSAAAFTLWWSRSTRRFRAGLAIAIVAMVAFAVSVSSGGPNASAHATAQGQRTSASWPSLSGTSQRAAAARTVALGTSASTTTTAPLHLGANSTSGSSGAPATSATLDATIAGIVAGIPSEWQAPGWSYTIVPATSNGAFGDTWGVSPPVSQFSRSQMTPLLASAGGYQTIKMVVLHEAENAKAYSVVNANDWSTVPGWPSQFAAQVSLEPGYDDVDAAANCLELGALGFQLAPSSGYAEEDISGGCSPSLAAWLTQQVAAATASQQAPAAPAAAPSQGTVTTSAPTSSASTSAPAPTQVNTPAPTPPAPLHTSENMNGPGTAQIHVTTSAPSQLVVTDQVTGAVLLDQQVPAGGGTYALVLSNADTDTITLTFTSGGGGSISLTGVS